MSHPLPFFARATARTLAGDLPFLKTHGFAPEVYLPGEALDGERESFLPLLRAWREEGGELTLHAPFKHLSPGASDPMVAEVARTRYRQLLEVAEEVRPRQIVFHHGYDGWRYEWRQGLWLEESLRLWPEVVERAAGAGVGVVFENVFDRDPEAMLALRDRLGTGAAGFCLDTGHFLLFSRVPLEDWLTAFGGDLREVHAHDNGTGRDEHRPVGEGLFDWRGFHRHLARSGVDPLVVLEHHQREEALPSREAWLRFREGAGR